MKFRLLRNWFNAVKILCFMGQRWHANDRRELIDESESTITAHIPALNGWPESRFDVLVRTMRVRVTYHVVARKGAVIYHHPLEQTKFEYHHALYIALPPIYSLDGHHCSRVRSTTIAADTAEEAVGRYVATIVAYRQAQSAHAMSRTAAVILTEGSMSC